MTSSLINVNGDIFSIALRGFSSCFESSFCSGTVFLSLHPFQVFHQISRPLFNQEAAESFSLFLAVCFNVEKRLYQRFFTHVSFLYASTLQRAAGNPAKNTAKL
jgi:hypothetical protein